MCIKIILLQQCYGFVFQEYASDKCEGFLLRLWYIQNDGCMYISISTYVCQNCHANFPFHNGTHRRYNLNSDIHVYVS